MDGQLKPKVTARVDYDRSRPSSPFKPHSTMSSPPTMIKPKAKINSSANVCTRKVNVPRGASPVPGIRTSGTPITRAPSPFKQAHAVSTPTSAVSSSVKAKVTARPNARTGSAAPETRQRSLTTVPSDSVLSARARNRRGSISSQSHHLVSPPYSERHTRVGAKAEAPSLEENGSPVSSVGNGMLRVKAKVTKYTESSPHTPSSVHSSPVLQGTRNGHGRTPSIPSISVATPLSPTNTNTSPTTTTAIHHHRFATTRESPTQRPHAFQPFPSNDDLTVKYSAYSVTAKVDPAAIPLPPQSPPMSAISFSSRSSASRSSVSYDTHSSDATRSTAPTVHSRVNGDVHVRHADRTSRSSRSSIDGLGIRSQPISREPSSESDGGSSNDSSDEPYGLEDKREDDPDRKRRDEAKSNRKIADLEITTRSLLAINSSLEAAKHRQAKEIRDLKRKLRESRLILPPPTYRAVKSSLPHDDTAEDEDIEEEEEDEEDEDEQALLDGKDDEPYRRVKAMMDNLLETCRRALDSKPQDFLDGSKGGAKVLSAEEVRTWRGDDTAVGSRSITDVDRDDASLNTVEEGLDDRPSIAPTDSGSGASEEEVEAALLDSLDTPSATLPPLKVTPPLNHGCL